MEGIFERSAFTETRAHILTQLLKMLGTFKGFAKFGHQIPKILPETPGYPSTSSYSYKDNNSCAAH